MRIFHDRQTAKSCKILQMLKKKRRHISFHTPGHKYPKWDITELSYSDNLSAPKGVIKQAQSDITLLTGAYQSFILTDGSTSGVLSMLYAARERGVKKLAVFGKTHNSFIHGCDLLNIQKKQYPLPDFSYNDQPPMSWSFQNDGGMYEDKKKGHSNQDNQNEATMYALEQAILNADGVFLTSPDYYGKIPPLKIFRSLCDQYKKILLVDGAHGGHLRYDREKYAGSYADLWVDGVHKSLPALTQGAVVSARTKILGEALEKGVEIFRTTSPSYPIMASVEYAVKYPYNPSIKKFYEKLRLQFPNRILQTDDETKISAQIGKKAFEAEKFLEKRGIYPEFCDGNIILFYLSYAQSKKSLKLLEKTLKILLETFPFIPCEKEEEKICISKKEETQYVPMENAIGKICAKECGLFPPCVPLLEKGEIITEQKIQLFKNAANVYGLRDGEIEIFKE